MTVNCDELAEDGSCIHSEHMAAVDASSWVSCEWFARCANSTDKVLPHPILGPTPCCTRCARAVGAEPHLTQGAR